MSIVDYNSTLTKLGVWIIMLGMTVKTVAPTKKEVAIKGMASGTFRLKPDVFNADRLRPEINRHSLSMEEGKSYPTVYAWTNPETVGEITRFDAELLYSILVIGLGIAPDDLAKMAIGEVFDVVTYEGKGK